MTPERWQQIDRLFHFALACEATQRSSFLEEACAGDESLLREVESLISFHRDPGNFIESPASDLAAEMLGKGLSELAAGQEVGYYRILSSLGAGGMGKVYLAEDTRLRRRIALKLLPAQFSGDPERVRRFEQEARAASALNHPNIITVFEIGRSDSHPFIATEYVDGQTLRRRMAEGAIDLGGVLQIGSQMASALNAAHAAGIVHRDIKPENVMLRSDGIVKVLDFGLAKLGTSDLQSVDTQETMLFNTDPGIVLGTVHYMSPEQARGQPTDARTDIWSLGIVLYEMTTGRVPFDGETRSHVIVSILETATPPLMEYAGVPEELERIVDKALQKEREERYQSINELAVDLKRLEKEIEVESLKLSFLATVDSKARVTERAGSSVEPVQHSVGEISGTGNQVEAKRRNISVAGQLAGRSKWKLALTVLASLVVTGAFPLTWIMTQRKPVAPNVTLKSVAVLPFKPLADDSRNEHLKLGMAATLINKLSGLHQLVVRPISQVLRYTHPDQDPLVAGRELGVDYVLEGNLQTIGDKTRANVQLLSVMDGVAVWKEQCDETCSDVFELQDAIAGRIARALALQLNVRETEQLSKRYTVSKDAYDFYSLAINTRGQNRKEELEEEIGYLEQAIRIDPKYALAYVELAGTYHQLGFRGFWTPREAAQKAEWAAMKAVMLDDTLPEAHLVLAVEKMVRDWPGVENEIKRALELDPNSAEANSVYSLYLAYIGQKDQSIIWAKRAEGLGTNKPGLHAFRYFLIREYDAAIAGYQKTIEELPKNPQLHFFLGEAYVAKGVYQEGIAELKKAVTLGDDPVAWDRYPMLAYAYAVAGMREEALKILEEQKRLAKKTYVSPYNFAIIYTGLGEKDRAFEYLNRAFDDCVYPMSQFSVRPIFDPLRSDPRYNELLRRMNREPVSPEPR